MPKSDETDKSEISEHSDDSDESIMMSRKYAIRRWIRANLLLILTLVAVVGGVVIGGLLRYSDPSVVAIRLIGFPGELFMNMLKALIIPLVASSIISGLAQLDGKTSGKLGSRAILYYILTTTHAVILGIIIVSIIQPGSRGKDPGLVAEEVNHGKPANALDKFMDLFRSMFTDNIIRATFQQPETVYSAYNRTLGRDVDTDRPRVVFGDGMNVLGVIMFCIVMGIVISRVGKPARPLAQLFYALDIVITKMVFIVMWFGVLGIPSLIAAKMLEVQDLASTAQSLGMYMLTVILGLLIQCFITLPLIYFIFTRQNPYKFLRGLGQAILTALATASSAASLPVTFQCINNLGVDPRVTKFVLPVGAMVNMDGTALYEAVASIFIAQMNGLELTIPRLLIVSVTATLASIGAASIPSAGLITMMIVLTALDLPVNDISLILAVDWFLDRLRTSVNVIGDAFGCGFVYYLCKDDLNEISFESDDLDEDGKPKLTHGVDFDQLAKNSADNNLTHNIQIA